MKLYKSIAAYFEAVNMPPPKHPYFYVGKYEQNIRYVKKFLPPVKYEMYSISILTRGSHIIKVDKATTKKVYARSPFRTVEWDVRKDSDIKGIIVMFSNEFINENILWRDLLLEFPFFRHSNFFNEDIQAPLIDELYSYFNKIYDYYYSEQVDKFDFIKAWLQVSLLLMRQEYNKRIDINSKNHHVPANRLLANFEVLLIKTLENPEAGADIRQPSFYASKLYVHVNHLNAIVKHATGKTTSDIIQEYVIRKASAHLKQTDTPVKSIAEHFNFSAPTHFVAFFKKHTGLTPKQYRNSN